MKTKTLVCVLAVLAVSGLAAAALAQDGYDLSWWTVDGGGGASAGVGYTLTGTAGQPDTALLGGGGYTLQGGLWSGDGAAPPGIRIYLPLIVRASQAPPTM